MEDHFQNNYTSKNLNNKPRSNAHSYDYYSSTKFYNNDIKKDNYKNFDSNNFYNNNNNKNQFHNNDIKTPNNFGFNDINNKMISNYENNYKNFHSNSLMNRKKSNNIYLANNKVSKGLKESKEQIEEIKKEINAL